MKDKRRIVVFSQEAWMNAKENNGIINGHEFITGNAFNFDQKNLLNKDDNTQIIESYFAWNHEALVIVVMCRENSKWFIPVGFIKRSLWEEGL